MGKLDCLRSCLVVAEGRNEIGARDLYDTPDLNRLKDGGDLEKRFKPSWTRKGCDEREINFVCHLQLSFSRSLVHSEPSCPVSSQLFCPRADSVSPPQ